MSGKRMKRRKGMRGGRRQARRSGEDRTALGLWAWGQQCSIVKTWFRDGEGGEHTLQEIHSVTYEEEKRGRVYFLSLLM